MKRRLNWVFDECQEIAQAQATGTPIEEREARWAALQQETLGPDGWNVAPHEANLVSMLGFTLAAERQDFPTARERLQKVFQHHGFSEKDPNVGDRGYFSAIAMDGGIEVACGNPDRGAQRLREVLDHFRWLQPARILVREQLSPALASAPERVSGEALTDLVRDVILAGFGAKKKARTLTGESTNSELLDALWQAI